MPILWFVSLKMLIKIKKMNILYCFKGKPINTKKNSIQEGKENIETFAIVVKYYLNCAYSTHWMTCAQYLFVNTYYFQRKFI